MQAESSASDEDTAADGISAQRKRRWRITLTLIAPYALVDFVNNVDQLAEAKDEVLKRASSSDGGRLRRAA